MNKRLDLTGQRFGKLTVIKFSHRGKWNKSCWLCKCDCGNEKIVNIQNLRDGHTRSCGCLRKQPKWQLPEGVAACNQVIGVLKRQAKRRGIEQALTDEQIIALHKQDCHYCGSPPSNVCSISTLSGSYSYNGIDRVDNNKGYTTDNSVPCCGICNMAKSDLTYNEFVNWIKQTYSHLNNV